MGLDKNVEGPFLKERSLKLLQRTFDSDAILAFYLKTGTAHKL